ncbi:putative dock-9 [Apostichopus japonicus]|uniref:Putative dock-9 n=1 Tax=Stichopus japonicus TaxID=307972 RepID=A0A2G8JX02_STIJA|nr:putative dock-9 [Apostichopus japonicus]
MFISTDHTNGLVFKSNVTDYEQPRHKYPVVDLCKGKINCIVTVRHKTVMSCSVEDVRPARFVGWFNKTGSSDTLLNSSRNTMSNGATFSSFAKINITVTRNRFYELLVCKSFNQAPSIHNGTAMVLLEPQHQPWISNKSEYGLLTKRTVLGCSISKQTVLIRKRRTEGMKYETIAYRMYNHSFENDASYRLYTDGSLIISSLSLENEGNNVCIYGTSEEQSYSVITLHAIVLSSINFLGCNSSVQCVLEVQSGDDIECSLKGVRPEVNLEFVYPDSSTPSPISLEGQPRIPENHGDVYDISIKSRVQITADADVRNITIVCRVTNSAIREHLMEAKAILTLGLSEAGQESSKSATLHINLLFLVIFSFVALVVGLVVVFVCFLACKRLSPVSIAFNFSFSNFFIVSSAGNLFIISEAGAKIIILLNNKIKSFKWNGDLVEEYTDESGNFRPFAGAVFEEKLYVTDKTSKCIIVFSTSLDYERNFGQDHLNRPKGITVCEDKGLLLVLNGGGESDAVISAFKPNGEYVIEIGQIHLEDPWYIKCNGTDEIFISDNGSREVTVFNMVDNKLVNRFSSDQADGTPMHCRE